MNEQQSQPSNGQVIAAAGAGAAILAGLVIGVGRRRERTPAALTDVLPKRPVDVVSDVVARQRRFGRRAGNRAADRAAAAEAQARLAGRSGRRRVERIGSVVDRETIADARAAAGEEVQRLKRGARETMERTGERRHEVTGKATRQAQRVAEQTTSSAQEVAAQAASAAVAAAERALDKGISLADAAKERMPQVTQRVSEDVLPSLRGKVTEEVVPSLRDVALQAASSALELWQTARERAVAASHADLEVPTGKASRVVEAGSERAREASTAVAEKASELSDRAKGVSKRTAEATVDTTKDTGALVLWAAAAGGLIFYALLTPERRDQLTRVAQIVTSEAQELIRDFQGYDDEF